MPYKTNKLHYHNNIGVDFISVNAVGTGWSPGYISSITQQRVPSVLQLRLAN